MSGAFGQADIQGLIDAGYGYAAEVLGAPFDVFRPAGADYPTDPANQIATLLAKFDISPAFAHKAPSGYASPIYYLLADASALQPGDYLVGAQGTWFIAGMEPNVPPLCVACNRTFDFTRSGSNDPRDQGGVRGYGGRQISAPPADGGEVSLMRGWPCSVLLGTKGESAPAAGRLPTDTRSPWWAVKVPFALGVVLGNTDRATDDIGRTYIISASELTDLGWSMTCMEAIV